MKTTVAPRASSRLISSFALLAACSALGLLAGCTTEPASVVVSSPPPTQPTVVVTNPAPAQPAPTAVAVPNPAGGNSLIVMQAPPSAQQEVPSARPSSSHVWVPGYWSWRNNQYQWMAGRWEVPPRVGAVWIPPRWQTEGSSYRFYSGYWE